MKSYRFDKLGSLDELTMHDEEKPVPQRGEVLIKIKAVALNRRDLMVIEKNYPGKVSAGFIPCSDAAGEIEAVGEDVSIYTPGDRVLSVFHPRWYAGKPPVTAATESYGNYRDGWLTQYKVIHQESIVPLPETLSWEEGATLPCAGVTAWNALHGADVINSGKTVLTIGSGSVSVFAIQLAKAAGATVISTTSSASKADALRQLGASFVVNYKEYQNWGELIKKEYTKNMGVDYAVDVVGPSVWTNILKAIRREGQMVLVGQLSVPETTFDPLLIKQSGAILRPIAVGSREMLEDLIQTVIACNIRPLIAKTFCFEDARIAFEELKNDSRIGKILIRVN